MSGVRRIDQDMASAAAELLPDQVSPDLRTRYRQLRIMLHTAGLAATYAFIAAKSGETGELGRAYRKAGQGICDRLSKLGLLPANASELDARAILTELGGMDAVKYTRASAEAAMLTAWLSRLADAVVRDQKEKSA